MATFNQVVASEDGVTQVHISRDENGRVLGIRIWEVTEFPAPTNAVPPFSTLGGLNGNDGTTSAIDISQYGHGSIQGQG